MAGKTDAFKVLMAAGKRKHPEVEPKQDVKHAPHPSHWSSSLKKAKEDPELLVKRNERFTVIKDKYPKAKFHYLVIPELEIHTPRELTKEHTDLLKEMLRDAKDLARKNSGYKFRYGFHAKPSMAHLHMHVISQDFVSDCLKTKKHWNSFNTPHFVDCDGSIIEDGSVTLPAPEDIESYLREALVCNQCSFEAKTMPLLKNHLLKHLST